MWLGCEGGAPTDGVIIGVGGKGWELVVLVKICVWRAREKTGEMNHFLKKKKTGQSSIINPVCVSVDWE